MADPIRLDLRWRDALLLAGGLALGSLSVWAAGPLLRFVAIWSHTISKPPLALSDLDPNGLPHLTQHLAAAALAPLTLAVAGLPLLRRGPERRAAGRLPGVVACRAVVAILILEAAQYPLYAHGLLYGELLRLQGDARNNIVQLPLNSPLTGDEARWIFAAVVYRLGEHAGFVALGVLVAGRIIGQAAPPPSALNRLGVALATAWLAITLGLRLIPLD